MKQEYAKYINETTLNYYIPISLDYNGVHYIGDLTRYPEVLSAFNFFPIENADQDAPVPEQGYHIEERYALSNYTIIRSYVSVEDPPAPPEPTKVYSKLKILMAAKQAGFLDPLIDLIESDREISYIWNASNTIEDNALLGQYIETIGTALGKTEEEIMSFLDSNCLID